MTPQIFHVVKILIKITEVYNDNANSPRGQNTDKNYNNVGSEMSPRIHHVAKIL